MKQVQDISLFLSGFKVTTSDHFSLVSPTRCFIRLFVAGSNFYYQRASFLQGPVIFYDSDFVIDLLGWMGILHDQVDVGVGGRQQILEIGKRQVDSDL